MVNKDATAADCLEKIELFQYFFFAFKDEKNHSFFVSI